MDIGIFGVVSKTFCNEALFPEWSFSRIVGEWAEWDCSSNLLSKSLNIKKSGFKVLDKPLITLRKVGMPTGLEPKRCF